MIVARLYFCPCRDGRTETSARAHNANSDPQGRGYRNVRAEGPFTLTTVYFFDFRLGDLVAIDDEGLELPNVEAAHDQAASALVDAVRDAISDGAIEQRFAIKVRDEIGLLLEVTAVFGSKVLRRQ